MKSSHISSFFTAYFSPINHSLLLCTVDVDLYFVASSKNFVFCFAFHSVCTIFAWAKIGCTSGMKAKTSSFALHSTRFALSLLGRR